MRGHLLRIGDLDRADIEQLLERAERLRLEPGLLKHSPTSVLGLAFFEPSTRTVAGFQSAIARMGGTPIVLSSQRFRSEMSEPEGLEDTIRVFSAYCDAIVFRHGQRDALSRAVQESECPVINGGNGDDEHPTQAIIDLFAIQRWHHRLEGLRVGIVGDLLGSRSAHSLLMALAKFQPAEIRLMYPPGRGLPEARRIRAVHCVDRPSELDLDRLDVVYIAGLPPGTGPTAVDVEQRRRLQLTQANVASLPEGAVVLCPLPRVDEVDRGLDARANFRYFRQSAEAQYVRTAILERVLGSS